jgi:cyclopropane fatty-acyl-phospholipid synthase-like methyltransferase
MTDPTSRDAADPASFWDERYATPEYVFGTQPNVWLAANEALLQPGMRALVPGDGEGRNGVWLAERGLVVTSIDASPIGVEKAQKLARARGVSLDIVCADLRTWQPEGPVYELVVSAFVHIGSADRAAVHATYVAAMAPGGYLILEGFTPDHLGYGKGGPKVEAMMFTEDRLRSDFAALDILQLEALKTELPASERHGGPAAVIRMLARKP